MKTHMITDMIRINMKTVVLVGATGFALSAQAQVDTSKCTMCHNPKSTFAPHLNGQTVEYFTTAFLGYKNGTRPGPTMKKQATLDEATLKLVAEFFASQPPIAGTEGDAALIATGKEIYEKGIRDVPACLTCHGAKGEGNGPVPRVSGQLKSFLTSQITAFQNDEITDSKSMADIAKQLSDEEIDAVTEYLQSL